MKWIFRILMFAFRTFMFKQAAESLRRRGVLFYLRALQVVRKSLIAAVTIFVLVQVMVLGLVGTIVAGVLLVPLEMQTKLWIALAVFGVMFTAPLFMLVSFLSDKTWSAHRVRRTFSIKKNRDRVLDRGQLKQRLLNFLEAFRLQP